jgi:ABC-2 type transport system ATP-binding protein
MMLLALAQRPELLVLDEPTDGLDPVVRRDMLAALLDYVSEHGATVFISSHLVHELERMCDWIGVMDQGRLVTELPMERFKNGIKRLVVSGAPPDVAPAPFSLLSRERNGAATETWLVRGWEPEMHVFFETVGASLQRVIDLDLEDGFVELLRTFRRPQREEVR